MPLRRVAIYAGLLYVVTVWALNTVVVKYVFRDVAPLAFTGLRFLTMTPLAFLFARATGASVRVERRDIPLLIACGLCGYGFYQYLWVLGLDHTTAFASALLGSLTPVLTLAIVAAIGTERVRAGRWIGAAVALCGVAVFEGAFAGKTTFRIGDGLTLIAAMLFACFNVLSARLVDRYSPVALVAITMAVGTAAILPGAIPAMIHQNYAHISSIDWAIFAYAVCFPILLTYPVWSYGLSRVGVGRAALFQFLSPIAAGALSVALLADRIEPHQIVGGCICIGGMALSQVLGTRSLAALWAHRTLGLKR